MQKTKYFLFFLCVFMLTLPAKQSLAQHYHFQNYSVEDGLPFIQVATVFQDSKGNLWSGGYGGLSKFDGVSFTNYSPKNGLLNHSVTCITEDNQGNLWIGTISGINKFDGENFTGYTVTHGLISNSITTSLKDKKGNLWFGTDKGISKLSDGTFINFSTDNGLPANNIKCIYEDKQGNIWIGTNGGVSVFDGKKFSNYTTSRGLPGNAVNGITQDLQNNMWIATSNGLCKLSNNKITVYNKEQGLADDDIKTIITNYKNTIWLGTNKGLIKFENGKFSNYPIRKDQNSNLISCLYQDYENNLWVGTYAGLFKYRGNPFLTYGPEEGLTNNFIFGIIRDSKKALWVGSKDEGLYKFQDGKFTQFDERAGLKAKTVNAVYEFSPGVLWLGTNDGLVIYDGRNFTERADSSGVFNRPINCFYKDSKNNVWMGSNNEIFKYNDAPKADSKKFTRYILKGRSEKFQVWTFAEDQKGTLWIGTYLGGLIRYNGNEFEECSEKIGLKNDSYLTSLIDKEGNLYFGSLDGLWMFNPSAPGKLVHFNESDGMSSDLIYSLTFGKRQDEIWAGTNQGLNKIDISGFKQTGKKNIIPFGKEEGFSGVECNSNGTWVDDDGSIWFGTVNGLIKYSPYEYIENKMESKTGITGFSLFYKDTMLLNNTHLSYSDNNITFYYTGICLTNPAKVRYSHILEGFEQNWSPPAKERLTNYSNLPPGTYTFKVISSNNEGLWNKVPQSFTFTVNIPFWKTRSFLLICVIVITAAFIFIVRYRISNIKNREKRKTELNKKIANIESQALRAQMNPHFIFNTLSSIQHYISNNEPDAALKYLSKFAKLMRKIMDNSKQQMISVAEELNALNLYLELEIMRFDKKFEYHIIVDPEIDQNYDRIPSMLIQPYVENAIIHGLLPKQGAGKISITLQKQNDTILCIVEDTGIGREKAKEFKKNRVQQHKSMGMSITQERLNILNSSLSSNINAEIIDLYETGQPSGTRVRLVIPLETNDIN